MRALEERFLAAGGIALLVTHTNTRARKFYQALGYEHVGPIADYVHPGVSECL
jgi:ribosomal protein S18 acetylase RimI-like enzyme